MRARTVAALVGGVGALLVLGIGSPWAASQERRAGRSGTAGSRRSGARVVLSGRMDQVCAELERLAAQEEALQRAA